MPADEKIFTFKEEEKERKIEEREKNQNLKIWEKNRPTREGCLRKICETDIEPSALAINPKVQKKINVAEAAGFTIPIERPKNRENRYKLIDKKREMFLVQQMLETKQREIQRLEDHAFMREDGLNCSEKMLEQDTRSFCEFFTNIKEKTSAAQRELEELKKKKNQKTLELRQISDEYSILVSSINKNIESMNIFFDYKAFLDQLMPKELQEEMDKKRQARKLRKEEEMRREQLRSSQGKSTGTQGKGKQGEKKGNTLKADSTGVDGEVQIPTKLKDIIDESDDEYPLYFNEADQLLEKFSALEEQNLFLIQQGQEAEQVLEMKKHEYDQIKEDFKKEIGLLEGSQGEVKDKIGRTDQEKNILENTTQDEQNKVLDPILYQKIEKQIKDLYMMTFGDQAESKMGNAQSLQLLNELEKAIDYHLQYLNFHETIDGDKVKEELKKIKNKQRQKMMKKNQELEKQLQKEKQERRQNEKEGKVFMKVGRPIMNRSEKPDVKKNIQVKEELTEEQKDMRKYLQI